MKKYSSKEIGLIFLYSIVTLIVIIITSIYVVYKIFVQGEIIDGIVFVPGAALFFSEYFMHLWWKDSQKRQRCLKYVVGTIVDRKKLRVGNTVGYAPVVRFEVNGNAYIVDVNITNKIGGESVNCNIGDEYFLKYNELDPLDFIPCSSNAEQITKIITIATILFHVGFIVSFMFLLFSFV